MKRLIIPLALFALIGCGGGGQKLIGTNIIMEPGNTFGPETVEVDADSDVSWTNVDGAPHTVQSDVANMGPDSDGTFANGLNAGQTYVWRVPASAASGTRYYYHCRFHGTAGNGASLGTGMVGVLIVR
ncbi:MAG: hypothetical protein K1X67_23570 [Fimbriimonadaceae bacterium]|nr:hypothetical protein [Fimbriimonadaceae bacterium]